MVRKQSSSSVQRHTSVVTQRKKLPDNITCGICRKDFTSAAACSEHMKMHSRARSAPTAATTSFSSNSRCLHKAQASPCPHSTSRDLGPVWTGQGQRFRVVVVVVVLVSAPLLLRENESPQRHSLAK
ncbi:uncharacterized protein LOC143298119 [Babylonia areolata]|uniref:uncharacterized protein LOC143298119 n=1 Tax=Babylonia areolata TaxID=304850 RepID=UPI003FD55571